MGEEPFMYFLSPIRQLVISGVFGSADAAEVLQEYTWMFTPSESCWVAGWKEAGVEESA